MNETNQISLNSRKQTTVNLSSRQASTRKPYRKLTLFASLLLALFILVACNRDYRDDTNRITDRYKDNLDHIFGGSYEVTSEDLNDGDKWGDKLVTRYHYTYTDNEGIPGEFIIQTEADGDWRTQDHVVSRNLRNESDRRIELQLEKWFSKLASGEIAPPMRFIVHFRYRQDLIDNQKELKTWTEWGGKIDQLVLDPDDGLQLYDPWIFYKEHVHKYYGQITVTAYPEKETPLSYAEGRADEILQTLHEKLGDNFEIIFRIFGSEKYPM